MKKKNNFKLKVTSLFRWLFYIVFKTLLLPYVLLVQNVRFRRNGFKVPKEPCLFMSNHASNWDGIYLELMFYKRVIHYIVNEVLFRNAIVRFIMEKILGMVRRGEGKNDMTSVKNILELKKKNKNIGIYPEGDIDMWGRTMFVDDSIAKLCKKLNMPIVLLRIDGAHLRAPRWGKLPRRSRIVYNITDVLTVDKIKEMSVLELHQKILDGINYDEHELQKTKNVKVSFPWGRAEHLEYGLFWCPKCNALHSLYTANNSIYCANCNLTAYFSSSYTFSSDFEDIPHNPAEWADRQSAYIPEYLKSVPKDKPVLMSKKVRMYLAPRRHFFGRKYTLGTVKLYRNRIEHFDKDKYKTVIYLKDVDHILLQDKGIFEVRTELLKIRFQRPAPLWSGYSWSVFANYLKKELN